MREGGKTADLAVIGGGAAGLAAAIFCGRGAPAARVVVLEGAKHLGAKILVSGGSRCNVTNRVVTERDYWGGASHFVRHVLRAFPAPRAARFFEELGVALHEEVGGKLFPRTNRSHTVLEALLRECDRLGIEIRRGARVVSVRHSDRRSTLQTQDGPAARRFDVELRDGERLEASLVVLATGGRSLPKTGSDGAGYQLAHALGHGYIETTPALAPLRLGDDWHTELSGVSHVVELTLRVDGKVATRLTGPLLWTHFGASGPAVLNVSRHWHRAMLGGGSVAVTVSSCPGESYARVDAWLQDEARTRPRASVVAVAAARVPAAVAEAWTRVAGIAPSLTMAHLGREARRSLVRVLTELPCAVVDSRGYGYAEVTAGGIPLDEVDSGTMESRRCPGLFLVGEMLDVDGRLGGFNFQWAWSSGFVAGQAVANRLRDGSRRDPEV